MYWQNNDFCGENFQGLSTLNVLYEIRSLVFEFVKNEKARN